MVFVLSEDPVLQLSILGIVHDYVYTEGSRSRQISPKP